MNNGWISCKDVGKRGKLRVINIDHITFLEDEKWVNEKGAVVPVTKIVLNHPATVGGVLFCDEPLDALMARMELAGLERVGK